MSVLYWPLNHISKTELQPFFLFNEYCLLGLHLQESFDIKVDAKEVSQIIRIHVLDVDSQIATIIADNHFSLHDAAYLDTKHIAVMVKQQLISEKFVFFSREVARLFGRLSLRLLVYVLPTQHRHQQQNFTF